MPNRAVKLQLDILADTKQAVKGLQGLSRQLNAIGKQLTLKVSLPIAAAGVASTIMAAKAEKAFAEVRTLIDETTVDVQGLEGGLRSLAKVVPQTLGELTQGLYQLVSAGVAAEESLEFLAVASKAAVAGVTDTNTAVDGLTTIINAFSLETSEATAVADLMFQTVKQGKLTFPELSNSIGVLASTAALGKVSLEDMFAAIATITKGGIKADTATISLNQALISFIDATPAAKKIASEFGVELTANTLATEGLLGSMRILADLYTDVEARGGAAVTVFAKMIPNIRALRAVANLAGTQFEEFGRIQGEMVDSSGSMDTAFQKMSKTLSNEWALAMETAKLAMIEFIEIAMPMIRGLVEEFRSLAERLGKMPDEMKAVIIAMLGMLAVIGPLTLAAGGLLAVMAKLKIIFAGFVLTSPFGWAIGATIALAGLVGTLTAVETHSKKLEERAERRTRMEKEYQDALQKTTDARKAHDNVLGAMFGQYQRDVEAKIKEEEKHQTIIRNATDDYDKQAAAAKAAAGSRIVALQQELTSLDALIAKEKRWAIDTESGSIIVNKARLDAYKKLLEAQNELDESLREEKLAAIQKEEEESRKAHSIKVLAEESKLAAALLILENSTGEARIASQIVVAEARLELAKVLATNFENTELQNTEILINARREFLLSTEDLEKIYAQERIRIWEKNNRFLVVGMRAFYDAIASELFRGLEQQRKFTRERFELNELGYDKEQKSLREQLGRAEISRREYNLRIAELDRTRRDNELRFEEAHASALKRIWDSVLRSYIQVIQRELSEFLYVETRKLFMSKKTEAEKTKVAATGAVQRIAIEGAETAATMTGAGANIVKAGTKQIEVASAAGPPGLLVAAAAITTILSMFAALKSAVGFAEGGLFRGKGSGKSDSNIIAVSDGEYIINAQATRRHKGLLDAINNSGMMYSGMVANANSFAEGGMISAPSISGGNNIDALLKMILQRLNVLEPVVNVDVSSESVIRGRDIHHIVKVEEKSADFRML